MTKLAKEVGTAEGRRSGAIPVEVHDEDSLAVCVDELVKKTRTRTESRPPPLPNKK